MPTIIIPEVSHPTKCCPHPEQWSCYDTEATEVEVLWLLRGFVIALKPKVLIETGCYHGFGTEMLASGMERNGFGHLWSVDIGSDMVQITERRLARMQLGQDVTVKHGTGMQLIAELPGPIDFAFLDSGPDEVRCHELRAVLPKLAPSGVMVVHDTGLQHGLRPHFLKTVLDLDLQFFMFDTPRGLSLVRRAWI